ncbi:MAG TPA: Imm21 family immunity protein [Pirellulaceae bacterium]|nr:Imm21 family immunity protein [Pirellulaceae bacterium]
MATKDARRGLKKYKYQCWEGGPHIVLPQSLKASWNGHQIGFHPLDPATDYGRAAAVPGDFGLISVGAGRALILAQSPPLVAWSPMSSADAIDLFILKSWSDQDLDLLIDAALEKADLQHTGDTWLIQDDQLGLYYAGDDPHKPIAGEITIPCQHGSYALWTYTHIEPGSGEVVMIRLIREKGAGQADSGT